MKNKLETLIIDCKVTRKNKNGRIIQGKLERQLGKMMVEIFPSLILIMLKNQEDRQKLKDLNPELYKN